MPSYYEIDTVSRTVGNATLGWFRLERLEVEDGVLYFSRPIESDRNIDYEEVWVLLRLGWTISRYRFLPGSPVPAFDWKLEPDWAEIDGPIWRVHDGYLDLVVHEGSQYFVEDADEFAAAMRSGDLSSDAALNILRAYQRLCDALRVAELSVSRIMCDHAPGLPG